MLIAMVAVHFMFLFQKIIINRSGLMETIPPNCNYNKNECFLNQKMKFKVKSEKMVYIYNPVKLDNWSKLSLSSNLTAAGQPFKKAKKLTWEQYYRLQNSVTIKNIDYIF